MWSSSGGREAQLLQEKQAVLHPLWNSIKLPEEGQQTLLPSEYPLQLEEENRKKMSTFEEEAEIHPGLKL